MFSLSNFCDKEYDYNIKLPKVTYQPSRMYQKYILKLYNTKKLKFITYLPNIKYKDSKFILKSNKKSQKKIYTFKKKYTHYYNIKNYFNIYSQDIFFDFLNQSNNIIDFIGNSLEDFLEQRNKDIFFYVHKTLLLCENLVSYSPVLTIYSSQLLQICNKLLVNYKNKTNKDLSKLFIELFENLYTDLIMSIENIITIINCIFLEYKPTIYELELPKRKIFLTTVKKFEINEENKKGYQTKFYTTIDTTKEVYFINNITEFVNVCLYHFISNKIAIRKCNNCNCYFIAQRRDAIYCNFPSPQNPKLSCSKVRNHLNSRQKEQNLKIKWLYDNIESIFYNNKSKKEYKLFWNKFKKLYKQKQNDIIYYKYTRDEMINWLNSIKGNPLQLIEKESNISDMPIKELEEQLNMLN